MSASEYVKFGIKGASEFGLTNYTMPKGGLPERIRYKKIHDGKKRDSFVDVEVKKMGYVPAPKYDIVPNMLNPRIKSNMCKGRRLLLEDDIKK